MIDEPNCYRRKCVHFEGIRYLDPEKGEASEWPVCVAFPDGIPEEIAFGDNLHTEPYPGDSGIQYEKEPE